MLAQFARGRTGNRVLADALAAAREEGLQATIYTHPLGLHGHGAGPTIGLWDRQQGVPDPGDAPLMAHTCWAIELNVSVTVAEWGGSRIRVMLEEDAHLFMADCDGLMEHNRRRHINNWKKRIETNLSLSWINGAYIPT
ncbi:MAG: hypothetical protein V3R87_05105 [Dehalococcoidia bacterium]